MSDIAIRVENLSKLYHIGLAAGRRHDTLRDALTARLRRNGAHAAASDTDLWALKDVSFEVKRGEVVGVIGRNGAGKSTLLKVLSRITEPTSGRAEIHGRIGSLLEVGTGFHPELTGRENIYLNGAILGMKRTEIAAKFDEIVQFAEIERFLDTPVKRYSSGMYVRLAFAVAAHLEPEILLVDEVLAVGDAQFQSKCLGKMGEVAHQGRTILFVSHNLGAVSQLCSRALWMHGGRVACDDVTSSAVRAYVRAMAPSTSRVTLRPADPHAAAFFTEAAIRDASGCPSQTVDVREPFSVYLEYTFSRPLSCVEVSFGISRLGGDKIFESLRSASGAVVAGQPGCYHSEVDIPAMFLLPGDYVLTIALHEPNVQFFDRYQDILQFQVTDSGSLATRYSGSALGQIMVRFPWKTEPNEPLSRSALG